MANEKRLIPLQKRIIYAGDVFNSLMSEKGWSVTETADFVKAFRTVDAVEVVRCKDCKRYSQSGLCNLYLNISPEMKPNDFCSYGERKNDGICKKG